MNNSKHLMNTAIAPDLLKAALLKAAGCAALCTVAILLPGLAAAADWEIDPVRIELSHSQTTTAMTLTNTSDQPTSIQIEVLEWSQVNGKDVYVPSKSLLVSPPIFTIPAHGEQIIRAALHGPADENSELSYRIHLQELPAPPVPGFTGVQVALRVGLPVFVQSRQGNAAPKMKWSVIRMPDKTLKVGLQNSGNAHVQVTDLSLSVPGSNKVIADHSGSNYIMAGQMHEWLLKPNSMDKSATRRMHLKANTDAGDVDKEIVLGKL